MHLFHYNWHVTKGIQCIIALECKIHGLHNRPFLVATLQLCIRLPWTVAETYDKAVTCNRIWKGGDSLEISLIAKGRFTVEVALFIRPCRFATLRRNACRFVHASLILVSYVS
jgi:hypothetical protein